MFSDLKHIPTAWAKAWANRSFRNQLITSILLFILALINNLYYLRIWQDRLGIQINDLVLNHLPPRDFSWAIFMIEYPTVILVALYVLPYPNRLVKGVQTFALIFLARTIAIYLLPLEPPKDMLFLQDPIAGILLHSQDTVVTKDLFFSGHISALAALYLISVNKYVKHWALLATIVVSVLILCQHVHYSMDVAFAPLASYLCYQFVLYIHRETKYGLELKDA